MSAFTPAPDIADSEQRTASASTCLRSDDVREHYMYTKGALAAGTCEHLPDWRLLEGHQRVSPQRYDRVTDTATGVRAVLSTAPTGSELRIAVRMAQDKRTTQPGLRRVQTARAAETAKRMTQRRRTAEKE